MRRFGFLVILVTLLCAGNSQGVAQSVDPYQTSLSFRGGPIVFDTTASVGVSAAYEIPNLRSSAKTGHMALVSFGVMVRLDSSWWDSWVSFRVGIAPSRNEKIGFCTTADFFKPYEDFEFLASVRAIPWNNTWRSSLEGYAPLGLGDFGTIKPGIGAEVTKVEDYKTYVGAGPSIAFSMPLDAFLSWTIGVTYHVASNYDRNMFRVSISFGGT